MRVRNRCVRKPSFAAHAERGLQICTTCLDLPQLLTGSIELFAAGAFSGGQLMRTRAQQQLSRRS
jgi:hypothetical protein